MKECSRNRKLIAWLLLDALDARQTEVLRDHLSRCDGCRQYWSEISQVTRKLAASTPDSDLEPSESFNRKVAEKLQATESRSTMEDMVKIVRDRTLNWRVAVPTIAALAIALVVLIALYQDSAVDVPALRTVHADPPAESPNQLAPTIANYQSIARESLEEFDELLTRQGNAPLPKIPAYIMRSIERANGTY